MSLVPIVSPAHTADGIALMPVITALYPFALDEGSVTTINCFLVKKISTLGSNQTVPTTIKLNLKRTELASTSPFTGYDYGEDSDAGLKYRSLIEITPASQLDIRAEYSVILSKDLAKVSVFDAKASAQNTGNMPLFKGPYTGLISDTYKVDIVIGGNEGVAKYKATRLSDGTVLDNLVAKKRFIEIEKGLFIKFEVGTYVSGDSFTVKVRPLVKTNEIYSWDFKTGDSTYTIPQDQNSNVIVGLPIDSATAPIDNSTRFQLLSVTPSPDSVMNDPANKQIIFTFNKAIKPESLDSSKIKAITESTVGNPYGPLSFAYEIVNNKLIINFQ